MSRTDLDAHTLARSLRRMAGDGSVEWVMEPIQASVLLDIADMLAENAELRELVEDMHAALQAFCDAQDVHGDNCPLWVERTDDCELRGIERRMRELGVD